MKVIIILMATKCPPSGFSGEYYHVSGGSCVRQNSFFEGKAVLNQGVGYAVILGFGAFFAVFTSFLVLPFSLFLFFFFFFSLFDDFCITVLFADSVEPVEPNYLLSGRINDLKSFWLFKKLMHMSPISLMLSLLFVG